MNKYIKIIISILILIGLYFLLIHLQTKQLKKSLNDYIEKYDTELIQNQHIERCNLNIFSPQIAYLEEKKNPYGEKLLLNLYFYNPPKLANRKYWEEVFIGSTNFIEKKYNDIKNKLTKNCNQFKINQPGWTYKAVVAKDINTSVSNQKLDSIKEELGSLNNDQKKVWKVIFGNWENLDDDELIKFYEKAKEKSKNLSDEELKKMSDVMNLAK